MTIIGAMRDYGIPSLTANSPVDEREGMWFMWGWIVKSVNPLKLRNVIFDIEQGEVLDIRWEP